MFESSRERKQEAENSLKNRGFRLFSFSEKSRTQNLTAISSSQFANRTLNCAIPLAANQSKIPAKNPANQKVVRYCFNENKSK